MPGKIHDTHTQNVQDKKTNQMKSFKKSGRRCLLIILSDLFCKKIPILIFCPHLGWKYDF